MGYVEEKSQLLEIRVCRDLGAVLTERTRTNRAGACVYHKLTKGPVQKKGRNEKIRVRQETDIPGDKTI